jgi:hypothetical protein
MSFTFISKMIWLKKHENLQFCEREKHKLYNNVTVVHM